MEKSLIVLAVAQFFVSLSFSVVSPIFSFFVISFGIPVALVGIAWIGFGVARIASEMPTGILAEKMGRKFVILLGSLLIFTAYVIFVSARTAIHLIAGCLATGYGFATFTNSSSLYVMDIAPYNKRAAYLGILSSSMVIAGIVGPPIGGYVSERYGLVSPFFVSLPASAIVISLIYAGFRDEQSSTMNRRSPETRGNFSKAVLEVVKGRSLLILSLSNFLNTFLNSSFAGFIVPVYGKEFLGLSNSQIGCVLGMSAVTSFILQLMAGLLEKCFKRVFLLTIGFLLQGISLLSFLLVSEFYTFALAVVAHGGGFGLVLPNRVALLADLTAPQERAMKLSVFNAFEDVGMLSGPITISLLASVWIQAPFIVGSSLFVIASLGLFSIRKR